MRIISSSHRRSFGIIGGLGPLAGADVLLKLVKATPARTAAEPPDLV
jgi:aspartate racemase